MYNTFNHFLNKLQQEDYHGFIKDNFHVSSFMSCDFSSHIASPINRIYNNIAKAIKSKIIFPKIMTIVLDGDFIEYHTESSMGVTAEFSVVLDKLMNDMRKMISAYKDFLPKKGKKPDYPHILWIEAPLHDKFSTKQNKVREMFNKALKISVAKIPGFSVLHLKKIWDLENGNLYLSEQQRFTAEGITTSWAAVENTVCYCITVIDRNKNKASKGIKKMYQKTHAPSLSHRSHSLTSSMFDHYSRKSLKSKKFARCDRKLPSPPRHHPQFYAYLY